MEIAKRLHPFSVVALALASGVVFGWILKQRRRPLI
jgi:hypothetical protein